MQIVIEIPDKMYEDCKSRNTGHYSIYDFSSVIANGKPLPKGHGRLIDVDTLNDYFWDNRSKLYTHKDLRIVIDRQPTIIEADKTESEEQE